MDAEVEVLPAGGVDDQTEVGDECAAAMTGEVGDDDAVNDEGGFVLDGEVEVEVDDFGDDAEECDESAGDGDDWHESVGEGDNHKGGGSGVGKGGKPASTRWSGYPSWAFKGGGKGRPGDVDEWGGVYVVGGYTYKGEFWEFDAQYHSHV